MDSTKDNDPFGCTVYTCVELKLFKFYRLIHRYISHIFQTALFSLEKFSCNSYLRFSFPFNCPLIFFLIYQHPPALALNLIQCVTEFLVYKVLNRLQNWYMHNTNHGIKSQNGRSYLLLVYNLSTMSNFNFLVGISIES